MQLSRRTLFGGLAGTAVMGALTACGGGKQPGSTGSAAAGGSGTAASAWGLSGGVAQSTFQKSFDSWNAANAGKTINIQFMANDAYKEKIRTSVGSGNAPTLIYSWAGGTLAAYVAANQVVDLTSGTADLQKRLIPAVVDVGKVNDKVYAVPNNNTQPVLFYSNKDVLSKAGVDGVPTTYDGLLSAVDKMKSAGINIPIALAGASQWPELMWIEYLLDRQAGPELFKKIFAGDTSGWVDPGMEKAATMVQELVTAGAFGDKYGSVVADANADAALVYTGKSGLLLQGAWVLGTFTTDAPDFVKGGKLGYGPFPAITGGKGDPKNVYGNPANFWSISASASAEQQKAAMEYLNTAMFNAQYVDDLIAGGAVPVTTDAASKLGAAENGEFLTYCYNMAKDAPSFQLSWDQALSASVSQTLLTNLSQLFLKQITPAQFCSNMQAAK